MALHREQQLIGLAKSLPPQLLNFFKRFPPPQLSASTQTFKPSTSAPIEVAGTTSSSDPNAPTPSIDTTPSTTPTPLTGDQKLDNADRKNNPFLSFRNPRTGNWHPPHYGLRRQAELYKLASQHKVLSLMPLSPKHPEVKLQKRVEHGLRVRGTGEGQKVKGKKWERTLQSRLTLRRKAVEAMPDMINLWKERGHGRGWKKFPRGKSEGLGGVFDPGMRHAWVHERPPPAKI